MHHRSICLLAFGAVLLLSWRLTHHTNAAAGEWREYLGGPDRNHYSPLAQIDTANTHRLQVAWRYRTGDSGQMQCNPLVVDGVLYALTANNQPFALDAATGKELWRWRSDSLVQYNTARGVTYWEKGTDKRLLFTNGSWLYAVDARTGKPITSFGIKGRTSLKAGLGASAAGKFVVSNAPGTVYDHLIIMPLRVHEGPEAAPGHIQAFNILTGRLQWVFHTIPQPGEYGYATFPPKAYRNTSIGGANNWTGMAIDRGRGLVFVPTGSAAFDYYGGNRKGANLFANCLLALDARTGKRRWHYQLVHHDILDRDLPAPPNLVTVTHQGKKVDAVAQVTKHGYVFVFDRETGRPLFPIEERPVPGSRIPGEQAWPTQPMPLKPAPFARTSLTEQDLSPYARNKTELLATFRRHRYAGPFTPLDSTGSIVFPGLDGGAEWGGAAADPGGILYVNSNEMAWLLALGRTEQQPVATGRSATGKSIYAANCASCHGADRKGNASSGFPSLAGIGSRRPAPYLHQVVLQGKGMMPSFARLSQGERDAVVAYLLGKDAHVLPAVRKEPGLQPAQAPRLPYRISAFSKFMDSDGLPAIAPPWGTLNAIDLNTGAYLWKIPFGEYPELKARGVPPTGAESYGGPVVTAGGLLFIAGTKDKQFRVFNKRTGELLWQTELPAPGFATPGTYLAGGRQYVVIACGGAKLGAPAGDSYVAFALPND